MATNQQFLVCDASNFANFFSWASAFNANLAAFTWVQSNDPGQVMWSGMSLTAVSMSGTNATYTYNSLTGLPLAVGRALTITGMTNSGNNKTVVITSFTGTTSGTFTVVNATGVNESGSAGVVTAQTTVPGTNSYVNEIWTPNDGLTNFFLKLEYGITTAATIPMVRVSMSTSTNGAGTLTGFVTTNAPWVIGVSNGVSPSTTTQFECNFSGGPGRFGAMMWRNSPNSNQIFVAVERSVNASGVYTGTHVTLLACGQSGITNNHGKQQSIVFGVGAAPLQFVQTSVSSIGNGWIARCAEPAASSGFNGSLPVDTVSPSVGFFDYPLTVAGVALGVDIAEGVPFSATLYGAARTYLPSKQNAFNSAIFGAFSALCMRYD